MDGKKPGVAIVLGLEPKKKKGGMFGESEDDASEGSDEDEAIGEFVSAVREGKDKAAISSFKNVMELMYAKWMDKSEDDDEEE